MRKFIGIALAAAALCGFSKNSPIHNVGTSDAEKLLAEGGILLLDVRTGKDYLEGHIPNAKLISLKNFSKRLKELPKDRTQPILIYCTLDTSSSKVAKLLARDGYKDIYTLAGGLRAWTAAKKPIETFADPKQTR